MTPDVRLKPPVSPAYTEFIGTQLMEHIRGGK